MRPKLFLPAYPQIVLTKAIVTDPRNHICVETTFAEICMAAICTYWMTEICSLQIVADSNLYFTTAGNIGGAILSLIY